METERWPHEVVPTSHEGWTRYEFEVYERPYTLLTIETETEVKSQVWPLDRSVAAPWPHYHHLVLPNTILTVDTAVEIIRTVYVAFNSGVTHGQKAKRDEFRAVLGL